MTAKKPKNILRLGCGFLFLFSLSFSLSACGSESTSNQPAMTAEILVKTTAPALPSPTTPAISNTPTMNSERPTPGQDTSNVANSVSVTTRNPTITITPEGVNITSPSQNIPNATTEVLSPIATNPPPTATPRPVASTFIFYLKGEIGNAGGRELWGANPKGENSQKLASGLFGATIVGDTRLLITQLAGDKIELKLLEVAGGSISRQKVLDEQQVENIRPSLSALAVSPDKTTIAYTKANRTAPTFTLFGNEFHSEELWLADLSFTDPAVRKLVPNTKDFIEDLHWSTDGNRLAFLHTFHASTGAGYSTEIWSVYKDGTHLAYLTGPDEGSYQGESFRAAPATKLQWVGPLALSFQSFDQVHFPLWLHNLSLGKDLSRPLSLNADPNSYYYCEAVRRYAFIKKGPKSDSSTEGIYTVSVDEPGEGPAPGQVFDVGAKAVFDCKDDNLLYLDVKGQIILAKLNQGGSAGSKFRIGDYQYNFPTDKFNRPDVGIASLAPDSNAVLILPPINNSDKKLGVYRPDGSKVNLQATPLPLAGETATWYDAKRLVLSSPKQGGYIFVLVTVGTTPGTVTLLDSALQKIELVNQK